MTTDPEEGRRQIEAMKPEPLQVGDKVRLTAGGDRTMTVVAMEDYGNHAVCEWENPRVEHRDNPTHVDTFRDSFPVRALVRVSDPQ